MPIKREGGSDILTCLPILDPNTGLLPPGRYAASLDELYTTLVASTDSAIRREIWEEWTTHHRLVEAQVGEVTRMWVGGSFVSSKPDPSDVDVTYLVNAQVYDDLDRETLTDLADLTDAAWCVEQGMRVDALLDAKSSESFRDLGLYDEVCQAIKPPSVHSVPSELRRGYVEVLL